MAINLMDKHSKKLDEQFYLDSVILGKTNRDYDWDGVKSIKVHDIVSVAPSAYNRTATSNRYGTPTEVQDNETIYTITQDRSVSLTVDKGNNTEQMGIKNAGVVTRTEIREQFVPEMDKYVLKTWANDKNVASGVDATLDETSIIKAITKGRTAIVNAKALNGAMYLYIGSTNFAHLLNNKEFLSLEKLGSKSLEKGVVGEVRGFKVVEVPDEYMPAGNNTNKAQFMIVRAKSVVAPTKFKDVNLHMNPPGLSGHQIDIRWIYDAFVLKNKAKGVYVSWNKAQKTEEGTATK